MEARVQEWLTPENIEKAQGKSREEIFAIFGNKLQPVAYIDPSYLKYLDPSIKDNRVYSGMGYFVEHAVNHHPEINIAEYGKIQDILNNPDDVKLDDRFEGRKSVVFIKKYDTFGTVIVGLGETENGKLVFHKTFFKKSKSPYPQLRDIRAIVSPVDGPPTISPADESTAAVNLSALDDTSNIGHFVRSVNPSDISQVRDANGEPLPVYHFTGNKGFDIFDKQRLGESTVQDDPAIAATAQLGFWFNDNIKNDSGILDEISKKALELKAVFLNIREPKIEDSLRTLVGKLESYINEPESDIQFDDDDGLYMPDFEHQSAEDLANEYLSITGDKDGIIVEKDTEFGGTSYITFSPAQIKSATDNAGTYGNENPSILFQDADTEGMEQKGQTDFQDDGGTIPPVHTKGNMS
jgi:hypothetical protein